MVKSVERTDQILELVGLSRDRLSQKELSVALKIPQSSLSVLLANLVELGYLKLDKVAKRYELGPRPLVIAGRYLSDMDIIRLGQPVVNSLMVATGESVALVVRNGLEILVVCKENCSKPLKRSIELGHRAPLYATAAGKVMLAYLSDEELCEYFNSIELNPITQYTKTEPEKLRGELKAIRSGAVAYNREEHDEGIVAIAAPVFNLTGHVAAAIAVPMPAFRLIAEKAEEIERALREASAALSSQLGFDPSSKSREAPNSKHLCVTHRL